MGFPARDLTGQRFSRWTVLRRGPNTNNNKPQWWCRCDCGEVRLVRSHLPTGQSLSCGCLALELRSQRSRKHGEIVGGKPSKEYKSWQGAKDRCYNDHNPRFKDWGGRGITMCDEWRNDFPRFLQDMGRCPEGHTLERINNYGHYGPTNCRWATPAEQAMNRRPIRSNTEEGILKTV